MEVWWKSEILASQILAHISTWRHLDPSGPVLIISIDVQADSLYTDFIISNQVYASAEAYFLQPKLMNHALVLQRLLQIEGNKILIEIHVSLGVRAICNYSHRSAFTSQDEKKPTLTSQLSSSTMIPAFIR